MVNRGRAVVKKALGKYKDIWENDHGEEVSPPSSPERGKAKRKSRQPVLSRKLSSEAPSETRQDSQSPEQSAARGEALAHLFDDDNTIAEDQDQPVPVVEPATALSLARFLNSAPREHQQAPIRESQPTAPSEELPVSPKPVPSKKARARNPASASKAPAVQSIEQQEGIENTDNMANANNFVPTNQLRHLRACMVCSIVKTESQFKTQGCPNCESFLQLRGEHEQVQACTSQVFEGLITVSNTTKSWVARWQRLEGYVPGVYAVQVEGLLPEDVISAAEDAGVHYIPRDGSVNEALPTDA
ncbi:hypothetical protein PMIN03_008851 [Paraphaeosphaeria minitans]